MKILSSILFALLLSTQFASAATISPVLFLGDDQGAVKHLDSPFSHQTMVTPEAVLPIEEVKFMLLQDIENALSSVNDLSLDLNVLDVKDCDGCELWHADCCCGKSFDFQWCPCPLFPPTAEEFGKKLCRQACPNCGGEE